MRNEELTRALSIARPLQVTPTPTIAPAADPAPIRPASERPRLLVGDRVLDTVTGLDGVITGGPMNGEQAGFPFNVLLDGRGYVQRVAGELERLEARR